VNSVFRAAFRFLTLVILLYFVSCSKYVIKSDITSVYSPKFVALNSSYDQSSKIYKIEFDDIIVLFRYADIDFLANKFSFTVNIEKTFKKKEIHCIPFYILQRKDSDNFAEDGQNGVQYSKSKNSDYRQSESNGENEYSYRTGVTPFYISVKNNKDNRI